jgi:Farnesoic acid 0-methyl transferase
LLADMTRAAVLFTMITLAACKDPPKPPITAAWKDGFERAAVGGDYLPTAADAYRITGGQLNVSNAYNHPMWLLRKLPRDAVIELDAKSTSAAGDIKVEAWGDGEHHAPSNAKVQYTSTGYVFIFGGWGNSKSIIARQSEHGKDVVARQDVKVEPGRVYHWKIVRKGAKIDWFVDDLQTPFLSLDDPQPLEGESHSYFAFSDWESDLWFDNLTIAPL